MHLQADEFNRLGLCVQIRDADPVLDFAVAELRRYLGKMIGCDVPIVPDDAPTLIWINIHSPGPIEDLPEDAFTIRVGPRLVDIKSTTSRGVLYGVYHFLEMLGCRWVHPSEEEEIVPSLESVALPDGVYREVPAIEHRGLALYGLYAETVTMGYRMIDWMAKNRLNLLLTSWDRPDPTNTQTMMWPEVADALLPEVQRRGILLEMSEHATHYFLPRTLFAQHPEWFALVRGERRPGQMCYSNDEAVQYFGERLAEFAVQHPEIAILGAWPLDGDGYCECEGCQNPDAVFKATARMAELVHAVRPDLTIEHLAYKPQTWNVPRVPIPPYMSVLVCKRTDQLARDWVDAMEGAQGAYYFEYQMACHYSWATNVWLRPQFAVDITRRAVDIGYRGIIPLFLPISTWWHSSLNVHFYAKACWSTKIDVEGALADYVERYFDPLGAHILPIFKAVVYELHDPDLLGGRVYGSRDDWRTDPDAVRRATDVAERILSDLTEVGSRAHDSVIARRVRRLRAYVEYFKLYFTYRAAPDEDAGKAAFEQLYAFTEQHAGESLGICTSPEFLLWRRRH